MCYAGIHVELVYACKCFKGVRRWSQAVIVSCDAVRDGDTPCSPLWGEVMMVPISWDAVDEHSCGGPGKPCAGLSARKKDTGKEFQFWSVPHGQSEEQNEQD